MVTVSNANPQLDDGYTPIANSIMDALARTRFSGYDRSVLDFIFRKTYGWSKKSDQISLSQFVDGTGLSKPHVVDTINRLVKRNIIHKTVPKFGNDKSAMYEFNKHYGAWISLPKSGTFPKMGTLPFPKSGMKPFPKMGPTISIEDKSKVQECAAQVVVPKATMTPETAEVLAYLNQKVGRKFRVPGEIGARLKDYTVADCKMVIDKKCAEWLGTKFAKNLDPLSLFRVCNFDRYLNQLDIPRSSAKAADFFRKPLGTDRDWSKVPDHFPGGSPELTAAEKADFAAREAEIQEADKNHRRQT